MSLPANPFPGPVPFRDGEPIFGRDREIAELVDRLVADRLVLLYSPSGAGKSSMLNAGVLPKMREREFHIRKTIRVGLEAPTGVNRYVWSCAASLEIPYTAPLRLTEVLGESASDLLLFDQFEEVLTAQPGDETGRVGFFKQLGEALRVHGRWAVFAIREDYLAPLTEYLEWLPTQLASSMRLNILTTRLAEQAITRPVLDSKAVTFEEGAVQALLSDLAPDGWVEPVQLQVVCKDLWEELRKQELPVITIKLLDNSGGAELALEKYYNNVVHDVAASEVARKNAVSERTIRDWFGESLISASSTRLQVVKGETHTGALPNALVDELERAHIVRSDVRRNVAWCELTHDRLIRPVTQSNRAWKGSNLSLLQRETESWVKNGSSPDRLLRGKSLSQAAEWARQHRAELNANEREYLGRSQRARRRRGVVILVSAAVFGLVCILAFSAEGARLESHQEVVEAKAKDAIQVSADQPTVAAQHALEAEHQSQDLDFVGRLFDDILGKNASLAEEAALRSAFLAATVQHDPRYLGSIPYTHNPLDPHCVWYSPDGSTLWALTFTGPPIRIGAKPKGQTQAHAYDPSSLALLPTPPQPTSGCPSQSLNPSGQPDKIQFSGPPGWGIFKQPDKVEFDAPKGHSPSAYVGGPAEWLAAAVVDPTGRRAAWITGKDNYVYVVDFATKGVTSLPFGDLHPVTIQFSPDGNILAAGGEDYLVRLWWFNASGDTWKAPAADIPLRAHADQVVSLAFSPDGRRLASQGLDRQIVVWKILPELAPAVVAGAFPEAFVPGVRLVATTTQDAQVRLTARSLAGSNAQSAPVKTFDVEGVYGISMGRDGRSAAVVTGSDRTSWEVIDLETGQSTGPSGRRDKVGSVALSDDGKRAALSNLAGDVEVFSLDSGKIRWEYDLRSAAVRSGHVPDALSVRSLAFLPDGRTLATGDSYHTITFWSLDRAGTYDGDRISLRNPPTALAFAPDGTLGASLDEMHTVRFWDVHSRQIVGGALQLPGSPHAIAFGADGKSFHVLMDGGQSLSWNIDLPYMKEEACRLAGPKCAQIRSGASGR
jgi:WD40 repeat protein